MSTSGRGVLRVGLGCLAVTAACARSTAPDPPRWCEALPRPANSALERVKVSSDWFEVYAAARGVYAIAEPRQFQEVISYLILGGERALLFDTGLGLDRVDLGGRVLEVLHVPGHTPDAVALLDRDNRLLWTGDAYYEGPIWLSVPETSLDDYARSIGRLAALAPGLRRLLPGHNAASADPSGLARVRDAMRRLLSGAATGREDSHGRVEFEFEGLSILTSRPLLEGRVGDRTRGGSGLTTWP